MTPFETELKLSILPKEAPRLKRHPLLESAEKRVVHYLTHYYDTAEGVLARAGIAVRLRQVRRRLYLTVKCSAPETSGLSIRPEWENEFTLDSETSEFDPTACSWHFVTAEEVRALLQQHSAQLLRRFTTRFTRTQWSLTLPEGNCEIALDLGQILAGENTLPIAELELESHGAPPIVLYRLARTLAEAVALWPEPRSKAERGFSLLNGKANAPIKSAPPPWTPRHTILEAFLIAWHECVAQVGANLTIYRDTQDPEAIHQIRVGLRRARSLLRLFAPLLGKEQAETWRLALSEAASHLSSSRDRHVLITELVAPCRASFPLLSDELAALENYLTVTTPKDAAPPYAAIGTLFLDASLAWTQLTDLPKARKPFAPFLAKRMEALRRRLRRRLAEWDQAPGDPHRRHRVRIALKAIRYTLEWSSEVVPAKTHLKQLTRAKRALDLLGTAQDWVAAVETLTPLLDTARSASISRRFGLSSAGIALAAAVVLAWNHPRAVPDADQMRETLADWFDEAIPIKGVHHDPD
ncbi:MAG: CHAD domain-containing protein [Hydrogenophilus sp.]|nr:CHAD domain-containing protein [Hydrogenophilus sp.]